MNQEPKLQALSVEYKVDFGNRKGKGRAVKQPSPKSNESPRLPRITRLLALAHHLQDLLNQGVVHDYADIARLSELTRTRVSQIMNLTLLAPQIQEEILFAPIVEEFPSNLTEHTIRMLLKTQVWDEQLKLWNTQG